MYTVTLKRSKKVLGRGFKEPRSVEEIVEERVEKIGPVQLFEEIES